MNTKVLLRAHRRPQQTAWAMAACMGALVALLATLHRPQPNTVDSAQPAPQASVNEASDFSRTFAGTTRDGVFATAGKDLVLSPELIKRFEYHLAAVGERSLDQIKAAIGKDLALELNDKGQKEALRILDAYLKFKTALGSVAQPKLGDASAASLSRHFKAIRDLRAQYFQSNEVQALFGNVDEYDDYMVQKVATVQNKSLSSKERDAQLEQLKSTLSPENRANVEQPVIHLTEAAKVEEARRQGATPAQIQQIRTNLVGAEAAQRLAALDQEETAWQTRIQQYREAKAQHPEQAPLLKATLFTSREQLRLAAYE